MVFQQWLAVDLGNDINWVGVERPMHGGRRVSAGKHLGRCMPILYNSSTASFLPDPKRLLIRAGRPFPSHQLCSRQTPSFITTSTRSIVLAPPSSNFSPLRLGTQRRAIATMEHVATADACPAKGPYSQGIKTPTAVYCSGQIHADPSGTLIEGTITEKTQQCFKNIEAILKASGSSLEKIVKVNIFLADMSSFAEMNVEFAKWVPHKPARSCVAVKQLPLGAEVEIECIALP
ncbi:hypothetical protein MKZ38_008415 [Zalerion maritima]|uniref:Uncharacterized protein n=1 Tax=Zalerion maritima TaxID=339359 RepID=A0AAD5WNM7_9PEZI|nr:hypothetical protein MKZ38_008415 [Zalerion maritima]